MTSVGDTLVLVQELPLNQLIHSSLTAAQEQNCERENNIQLRSKVDVSLAISQSFQKRSTHHQFFSPVLLVPHQGKIATRVAKSLLFQGCKLFWLLF